MNRALRIVSVAAVFALSAGSVFGFGANPPNGDGQTGGPGLASGAEYSGPESVDRARRDGALSTDQLDGRLVDEEKVTLVGGLSADGPTWSVQTATGSYAIRFGNSRYLSSMGIDLRDGAEVAVFGYLDEQTVIPILIVLDGEAHYMRDTDGSPLWGTASDTSRPRYGRS